MADFPSNHHALCETPRPPQEQQVNSAFKMIDFGFKLMESFMKNARPRPPRPTCENTERETIALIDGFFIENVVKMMDFCLK